MFNSLYQGNMSLHATRLSRNSFPLPGNKGSGVGSLSSGAVQFINNIKSTSSALSGAIRELSGSAFSMRTVNSSNTEAMTVNYTGNKPNSFTSMSVKIDQTAAAQRNEGTSLTSKDTYAGTTGKNEFSVQVGSKTTNLSVNVSATDTNRDVQQKMAEAINNAGIGVKASVVTDSLTNSSLLRIESTTTGTDPKNSFTVSDISGDMVENIGANEVKQEGRDAIYSVNGGPERTSQSNTVYLGNGVNATFLKASEDDITISKSKDMGYAIGQVEKMVSSYNSLFSESAQRLDDHKSQNLASRMLNTSKTYKSSLSNIGVDFDSSGRMTIDKEKLNKAAESGKLEQFFTENRNRNYGFTNQLGRLADNVNRNTSNYVSSSQFGSALGENFSYSSFGDLIQYNYLSAGSIFDFLL